MLERHSMGPTTQWGERKGVPFELEMGREEGWEKYLVSVWGGREWMEKRGGRAEGRR